MAKLTAARGEASVLRSTASRAAERRPSVMGGRPRLRGLSGPGRHHHCTASRIRSTERRNNKGLWDRAGKLRLPFAGGARSHKDRSLQSLLPSDGAGLHTGRAQHWWLRPNSCTPIVQNRRLRTSLPSRCPVFWRSLSWPDSCMPLAGAIPAGCFPLVQSGPCAAARTRDL